MAILCREPPQKQAVHNLVHKFLLINEPGGKATGKGVIALQRGILLYRYPFASFQGTPMKAEEMAASVLDLLGQQSTGYI